jgi:hypothetical protein
MLQYSLRKKLVVQYNADLSGASHALMVGVEAAEPPSSVDDGVDPANANTHTHTHTHTNSEWSQKKQRELQKVGASS